MPFFINYTPEEKKKFQKRSKTISVLVNVQNPNKLSVNCKKSLSMSNIPQTSNQNIKKVQINNLPSQKTTFQKMTDQILKMMNRELQAPQLFTYIHEGIKDNPIKQKILQNPQSIFPTKNERNIENCPIKIRYSQRIPQYLSLLKRTQTLTNKSFVPHLNWKQKLSKLKNMGKYGHIYKKNSVGISQKISPKRMKTEAVYIAGPHGINQGRSILIGQKSQKNSYNRCHTTNAFYSQTCQKQDLTAQKDISKRFSVNKSNKKRIVNQTERDWSFEPWDIKQI